MNLFLDANVLFTAAHNPRGKAALVVELGGAGCWRLFTSSHACEEARRNLAAKFPDCVDSLNSLLRNLRIVEHRVNPPFPETLASKDQPVFQAAFAGEATHLLTGDLKDFGPFMNRAEDTFGILIQTVGEFLQTNLGRPGDSANG